ncbi:hypothetical protein J5N97_009044 [Dioscorea zingiberensis]|uniref:F-box domain-containing protein n=1 Tax=Dioscorea zingiberensis TaxID=325984 RepID=A0A9D5CXJ9_9LILI|nr:hypothetical protein J5N97_009044 [Dioscorea zingiberensis]
MDETKRSAPSIDDFIGEDALLCKILSKLSLAEAVRTSVLNRRWRYIWTYLPNLQATHSNHCIFRRDGSKHVRRYTSPEELIDEAVQIMDSVVNQHCGFGLETFEVDIPFFKKYAGSLDRWVAFAAAANVKELVLKLQMIDIHLFPMVEFYEFPFHLLFQQKRQSSIERLYFEYCSLQVPDGIGRLRSLRTLTLHCVNIDDVNFQNLVSTCSVMECLEVQDCTELVNMSIHQQSRRLKHLTVYYCPSLMSVEIQAAHLDTFAYTGYDINLSFDNLSSVTEGSIYFSSRSYFLDYVLMTLPNVLPKCSKLTLWIDYETKLTCVPEVIYHRFEHLKHLVVTIDIVIGDNLLWLVGLLAAAPLLEKFNLHLHLEDPGPPIRVPVENIPLAHLKEVEIYGFTGSEGQLIFLQYLCHNASSLKLMRIIGSQWRNFWSDPEEILPSVREETLGHLKRIVPPGLDFTISYTHFTRSFHSF